METDQKTLPVRWQVEDRLKAIRPPLFDCWDGSTPPPEVVALEAAVYERSLVATLAETVVLLGGEVDRLRREVEELRSAGATWG
jgi:hypothetical protein